MVRRSVQLASSPALFRSPVLDRLTRTRPRTIVVVYVPLVLAAAAVGMSRQRWWPATVGLLLAGYVLWTLTEYWVHRAVFHFQPRSARGARLHWVIHGLHHAHPNDPDRLVMPPAVGLPVVALVWTSFALVLPGAAWGPVAAGWLAGYVAYDLLHHHLHQPRQRTALGRWLRRHHLRHHFADDGTGFGLSAPYWDTVFGTRAGGRSR
jgi:sterol desaturase/sphingolipid hydroxylase (fatty acid hydroxylase superfamily)